MKARRAPIILGNKYNELIVFDIIQNEDDVNDTKVVMTWMDEEGKVRKVMPIKIEWQRIEIPEKSKEETASVH